MRGKGDSVVFLFVLRRITPAYAGKSRSVVLMSTCTKGSPPRMRGKVKKPSLGSHPKRITPAYAGKRLPRSAFSAAVKDHPRVCGEKRQRATRY